MCITLHVFTKGPEVCNSVSEFDLLVYYHLVDGRIIFRWIFRRLEGVVGTGWSWLRIGTGDGNL
jgi:hypothetical protein